MDEGRAQQPSGSAWYALAAAALFGLSTPFSKSLLARVSPLTLAGLLYLGSGAGLALFLIVRLWVGARPGPGLERRHAPRLLAVSLLGGLIAPAALMMGLSRVSSTAASLLLNLEGAFNVALAALVLRESLAVRSLVGIALVLAGAALVGFAPGALTASSSGVLLISLACLAWGLDNTLTSRLSHLDPAPVAAIKGFLAAPFALVAGRVMGERLPAPSALGLSLGVGTLAYGAGLVCFMLSLRAVGLARTGAIFATAPFIGAVASAVALRERPTLSLVVAGVLMGAGVRFLLTKRG